MSTRGRRWRGAAGRLRAVGRAAGRVARDVAREVSRGAVERPVPPPSPAEPWVGYAPVADHRADPGEVVWAWVPFEENPRQGKDRPVLVIGRHGNHLLALQLTSKDHDLDFEQEAAQGRFWIDVGTGAWDRYRRPSEARVNRVLRLGPDAVRRTGARLEEGVFAQVLAAVREHVPDLR